MNPSNPKPRLGKTKAALLFATGLAALSLGAQPVLAATARDEATAPDPFEKINRVFFYANGALDFLVIRPAASTFKRLTPRPIREGLHNAFSNMGEPTIILNDAFQGHGKKAIRTFGRFAENSTLGVLGLFDVASKSGLPYHDNDFGITLARWGVKSGPYIFIPILGPATVRDGFGDLVNLGLDPFTYSRFPHSEAVYVGRTVETGLDQRMAADKDIKAITATATDDYASIRSYFLQSREADITGEKKGDITNLPDFGEPEPAKPVSPGLAAPSAPSPPASSAPDASTSPTPGAKLDCTSAPNAFAVMSLAGGDGALVTGATGFVGSAVARALLAESCTVRVLARPSGNRRNLDGLNVEVAEGDLGDSASLIRAMSGVRHLFHVAADYRLWAKDPEEIVRNNLSGTRAIMQAAQAAGVERIVYTSSVATLNFHHDGRPSTEDMPLKPQEAIGAYKRSKVSAERLVEAMVRDEGLPAVIVNPSTPIGPRDIKPTPTGRVIVEAATGKIPAFVDTGLNLVHVDDVAAGHLMALKHGRIGERYILGGEDVSLRQMLTDIAGMVGRKPPTVNLPRAPLYPLAVVMEMVGQATGKEPMLTRDALKMASHRMFFSSEKAKAELGYSARPYREGLKDALAWFRAEGYLG